jgi:hypothetical protein
MIAREFGTRRAAPTPWSALARISCSELWERPHQAEARANSTTPTENIRRRPRWSPRDPPTKTRAARKSV